MIVDRHCPVMPQRVDASTVAAAHPPLNVWDSAHGRRACTKPTKTLHAPSNIQRCRQVGASCQACTGCSALSQRREHASQHSWTAKASHAQQVEEAPVKTPDHGHSTLSPQPPAAARCSSSPHTRRGSAGRGITAVASRIMSPACRPSKALHRPVRPSTPAHLRLPAHGSGAVPLLCTRPPAD